MQFTREVPGNTLLKFYILLFSSVQSLSRVRLFATPWSAARQASLSITNSRSLLKLMSIESVMPSNYLILCHPLLLPPSIPPSIRVFSNESVFHIRWPTYWSFSFSISPSSEYSGLISFRMDWFDLFAVQGTLKSLLQHHSSFTLCITFILVSEQIRLSKVMMLTLIIKTVTWDQHTVAHEPKPSLTRRVVLRPAIVHEVAALGIEDSIWVEEWIIINIFKMSNADWVTLFVWSRKTTAGLWVSVWIGSYSLLAWDVLRICPPARLSSEWLYLSVTVGKTFDFSDKRNLWNAKWHYNGGLYFKGEG